jgi:beta-N-acetylhexosaminidase
MKSRIVLFLVIQLIFCSSLFSQDKTDELDKKIGQMICVGFRGLDVDKKSPIIRDITKYQIGGIVLFDYDVMLKSSVRNVKSPKQLKNLVNKLQKYSKVPLFVTIDQEGGRINRLKERFGFPKSVSAAYLGELDNVDSTRKYASECAKTLKALGINIDFAPCVDLNLNPDNPIIGKVERSFSDDPEKVIRHAEIFLDEFKKNKIAGTLKHFPGHGSSKEDSQLGFVDVTDVWHENELLPYKTLISKSKCDFVMTTHVFNGKIDKEFPATLSKKTLTDLLRNELRFDGIIFTDDMEMKAIADNFGLEVSVEKAIIAGVDILTFANNITYDEEIVSKVVSIIKNLIFDGKITEDRIDQSYQRIMAYKKKM